VSDTPRTDGKAHTHPFFYVEAMYVSADFARELERENAELRRLAARRAAFIEHHGLNTPAHDVALFSDRDESVWEDRVRRFMEIDRAAIVAGRAEKGGAT
jgi:hypothetical protein